MNISAHRCPATHAAHSTRQASSANRWLAILAMALVTATPAHAQFVQGNEAVTVLPDGHRKVDLPPMPRNGLPPLCPHENPVCAKGGWMMVETPQGLQECTDIQARSGACRPSTYGKQKLYRRWIVKAKGHWLQCEWPSLDNRCVSLTALPYRAMQ